MWSMFAVVVDETSKQNMHCCGISNAPSELDDSGFRFMAFVLGCGVESESLDASICAGIAKRAWYVSLDMGGRAATLRFTL